MRLSVLCLATCAALLPAASRSVAAQAAAAATAGASAGVSARPITVRQLRQLRWIVGDWRGEGTQGTTQSAFFERYRFADDSTLLVESFADSSWSRVTETSRYALRGGRLANEGTGARWQAERLDASSVRFVPVARARNAFVWQRAGKAGARPKEWLAVIEFPAADGGAPQRRHYRMSRVR